MSLLPGSVVRDNGPSGGEKEIAGLPGEQESGQARPGCNPDAGKDGGHYPEIEPVSLKIRGVELSELKGLPKYVRVAGWVDNERLLLITGTNPLVYNLPAGEYRALNFNAWWTELSPDGKRLAYGNEEGINLVNIDGSGRQVAVAKKGKDAFPGEAVAGPVDGLLWGPDSSSFLCWRTGEWDSDYFVFNPGEGKLMPVSTRLEGYMLTSPAGWLDEKHVLFATRAHTRRDGSGEYNEGYRQDLAVADLETGAFKLLTAVEDGVFLENAVAVSPHIVRYQEVVRSEKGNSVVSYRWLETDLIAGTKKELPWQAPKVVYISPGGQDVLYPGDEQNKGINNQLTLYYQHGMGAPRAFLEVTFGDFLSPFYWAPDGKRVAFSLSFLRCDVNNNLSYEYRAYVFKVSNTDQGCAERKYVSIKILFWCLQHIISLSWPT